jgi:hypothetical protein
MRQTGGYRPGLSVYALKADGTLRVCPPAGSDKDIATGRNTANFIQPVDHPDKFTKDFVQRICRV